MDKYGRVTETTPEDVKTEMEKMAQKIMPSKDIKAKSEPLPKKKKIEEVEPEEEKEAVQEEEKPKKEIKPKKKVEEPKAEEDADENKE